MGDATDLCSTTEDNLQEQGFFTTPEQSTEVIMNEVLNVLTRYDRNTALQYANVVFEGNPPLLVLKQLVAA